MPAALPADRGLVEFNSASPAGASTAPPAPRRLLGDVITDLGFASRESVEAAVAASQAEGRLMGELLVERGVVSADQLARAVAQRFSLDYLDLALESQTLRCPAAHGDLPAGPHATGSAAMYQTSWRTPWLRTRRTALPAHLARWDSGCA